MLPLLFALTVTVPVDAGHIDLARQVEILEDPSGQLSFVEATRSSGFVPTTDKRLNFGYSRSAYWLRTTLAMPKGNARWFLELGPPLLDHVSVYMRVDGGPPAVVQTGDKHEFSTRGLEHPGFLFALPHAPGRSVEVYIRVQSSGALLMSAQLWQDETLIARFGKSQLAWGFYFAFILALAFYNLFLYTAVRDRSYLFYVGYLFAFIGLQSSLTGHAFQYLWRDWPAFGSMAPGLFLCLSLSMACLFTRDMANVVEMVPWASRPLQIAAGVFLALVPLLIINYSVMVRVATGFVGVCLILIPVPLVQSYLRGYRPARYLILGAVAIFPAGLLAVLRYMGVLPANFATENAIQIGTALEALLLSFALADRINLLKEAEEHAHTKLLAAEQSALEAQRDLSRRLIDAQDGERRRIASELHDGLGQDMLVIVNKLKRAAKEGGDLDEITGLASQTISDLRNVAHGLHPHKLDRLGLKAAAEETVAEALTAADIDHMCNIDDVDGLLEPSAQLHIYRIIQEAVANIVKHAAPSEVSIVVRRNAGVIELRIEDDGVGLRDEPTTGLGLAGIEERTRLLGGELRIDSTPGEGVALHVDIPVEAP